MHINKDIETYDTYQHVQISEYEGNAHGDRHIHIQMHVGTHLCKHII